MNTEQAKLILGCIRNAAEEDPDLEIRQALAMLDSDPDLRRWYDAERAFDAAISSRLAELTPPPGLRASLLALLGTSVPDAPSGSKITWFRRPRILAAAAAVILIPLIAIQLLTGRASASFEEFRSDMVGFTSSEFELDHRGDSLPELTAWLDAHNATSPVDLPACVACAESIGCKIIDWNGDNVTLICLRNDTREVVHCFIIPRAELRALPPEARIRGTLTLADRQTCCWTDEQNVYLLVASAPGVKVMAIE